jgi:tetratricopeptide (TPR) repeat protein
MRLLLLHSPDDDDAAKALRSHLEPVCRQHRTEISDTILAAGDDVLRGPEERIRGATHIVVIVSPHLLAWRLWTGAVGAALAGRKPNEVLLVLWKSCVHDGDEVLRRFQPFPEEEPIAQARDAAAALTAVARRIGDRLRVSATGPRLLALGNLPSPEQAILGRERERAALDAALDDRAIHLAVVVGEGGAGKTQLVRTWLDQLQPLYGGADAVISCSIEDQGGRGGPAASAAVGVLLAALGDKPSEDPMASVFRLAQLVRARSTIVVIDGLEPLQDSRGEITDRPMRTLIRELASQMNGGLLVITTRPPCVDLDGFFGARRIDLGPIDPASAVQVLRSRGVHGLEEQLARVSGRLRGHALSLALVADYLVEAHEGDAMAFEGLDLGAQDIDDRGRLDRILSWHERRWAPEERAVLGVVALCEGPATLEVLRAFTLAPAAPGFASALGGRSLPELQRTCTRLERTALLSRSSGGVWDQHPLVRGWWRARLMAVEPAGVRAAHERLFEHHRAQAPRAGGGGERREDLEPLYAAVAHGVQAGRWRESFAVLHDRIREGERHTSLKKHGMVAEDLRAFLSFFERSSLEVRGDLAAPQRHWLENSAGVLLRVHGRAAEAVDLLQRAVRTAAGAGLVAEAAESARNLASVLSLTGDLTKALEACESAVHHADLSGETRARVVARDFRAHLLHRFGRLQDARADFVAIEQIRDGEGAGKMGVAHYPFASQAALFIDLDEVDLACDRARRGVDLTRGGDPDAGSLLNRGLSRRSLGRALAALGKGDEAAEQLEAAVELVRQAGRYDHLAPCHIDCASFWADLDGSRARSHLAEARRVFEGRGFRLIEGDAALTTAHVALLENRLEEAGAALDLASMLLDATRYRLRLPRLHVLQARLAAALGDDPGARSRAELAGRSARDMGLLRRDLWRDIEALPGWSGGAPARA